MRWVRHRATDNKRLFPYSELETYNDCDELLICLSERSLNIILNALKSVEEMRTRVWTTRQGDLYYLADDSQFSTFNQWMSNVYNELGSFVMCNEYLERIAVALEAQVQAIDEQSINLVDVAEALGVAPTETEADILEALDYLLTMPGIDLFPNFKIPKLGFIQSYLESRYKSAHLQLLRDMSISQRGMAVAQGGVDFASLYDTMGETADSMLVKAGYLGKAYWIWRWIDNDQIPGWLGWLSTISGLILGSIRDAGYKVANAIEAIDLTDIPAAIREQTNSATVNCVSCGGDTIVNVIEEQQPGPGYVVPEDSGPGDGIDPPNDPQGDIIWDDISGEDDWKCQAAKYIHLWMSSFFNSSAWNLSLTDNLVTVSEMLGLVLAGGNPFSVTYYVVTLIVGKVLVGLIETGEDFIAQIATVWDDNEEDIICALYTGSSIVGAADNVRGVLDEEGSLTTTQKAVVDVLLKMVNLGGILFWANDQVNAFVVAMDDTCDCETEGEWQFVDGIGSGDTEANPMVLSGVLSSGKYRLFLCRSGATENIQFVAISGGYDPGPSFPGADDAIHVSSEVCGESPSGDLYEDDDFPDDDIFDCGWIGINSDAAFTVQLLRV